MTDVIILLLCVLVIAQTIYKVRLSIQNRAILIRVERLLTATETHSRLNREDKELLRQMLDIMKSETSIAARKAESAAKEAKEEIKTTVEQVPDKVVEKMQEASISDPFKSAGSSVKIGKLPTDSSQ